jgi:uncharacterized protein YdaU (DUF1376 family)
MKDPAFLFYVRDWLCSSTVSRMTGDQVKAYVYLLCAAWLEDDQATLPADDESLSALARVDLQTWQRIKEPILAKFSDAGNGRIFNDRQFHEYTRRKQLASNAAEKWKSHKKAGAL